MGRDIDLETESLKEVAKVEGKTVASVAYKSIGYDEATTSYDLITLFFTDGTSLELTSVDAEQYASWIEVEIALP